MKRNVIKLVLGVFVVMAFGLAGCGGGGGGGTPVNNNTASLTAITITPASPSIATGASQQFSATGTYSDNSTQNITTSVSWTSSDTSKATISNTGLATAVTAGTTTIKAMSGSISGTSSLTITPEPFPSKYLGTYNQNKRFIINSANCGLATGTQTLVDDVIVTKVNVNQIKVAFGIPGNFWTEAVSALPTSFTDAAGVEYRFSTSGNLLEGGSWTNASYTINGEFEGDNSFWAHLEISGTSCSANIDIFAYK